MIKDVSYEPHHFKGINPLLRDYPSDKEIRIFGGDTETVKGNPHTLQISGPEDEYFYYVNAENILPLFLRWILPRCKNKAVNICYFHTLRFDLRILFAFYHKAMYEQYHDIHLLIDQSGKLLKEGEGDPYDTIKIQMLYGKVNKAAISFRGSSLTLFDSFAFTQSSLARSLKMFSIPIPKLQAPAGLGDIPLQSQEFEEYAMQDARAVRALGLKIMSFHERYHVAPSMSLPSFAARVFRRKYLKLNESIPFPPVPCVKAAEMSFHGGKNWYSFDGPKIVENVYEVDISSAYPFAMSELPPITKGKYLRVKNYRPGYVGIYQLYGAVPKHEYPLFFSHSFDPLEAGNYCGGLWHTSYETKEILDSCDDIEIRDGWIWIPGKGATNPLARYSQDFYKLKQSSDKSDPNYHFYKIMLNALFGKLVSTIEVVSDELKAAIRDLQEQGIDVPDNLILDERWDYVLKRYVKIHRNWKAGAFYNPFWATLITGHCRAYLSRLERKFHGIHSATDAIKTTHLVKAVDGLGGIKVEAYGRCYFFRNKLYLHLSHDNRYCGHDLKKLPYVYPKDHPKCGAPMVEGDQHLCKVALHGFKGPLSILWDNRQKLVEGGRIAYEYTHVVGLREGMKREERPGDFVKRKEDLIL